MTAITEKEWTCWCKSDTENKIKKKIWDNSKSDSESIDKETVDSNEKFSTIYGILPL
jgi:hypothetical protein